MNFDGTIHGGDLILLAGTVLTLLTLHRQNIQKMSKMSTKVDLLYRWFEQHIILGGRKASFKDDSDGG